jgi:hypothetical protein
MIFIRHRAAQKYRIARAEAAVEIPGDICYSGCARFRLMNISFDALEDERTSENDK